jgi:hypothetical protein
MISEENQPGKRQPKTEAADPELSDVMKARMRGRRSMRSRD